MLDSRKIGENKSFSAEEEEESIEGFIGYKKKLKESKETLSKQSSLIKNRCQVLALIL